MNKTLEFRLVGCPGIHCWLGAFACGQHCVQQIDIASLTGRDETLTRFTPSSNPITLTIKFGMHDHNRIWISIGESYKSLLIR